MLDGRQHQRVAFSCGVPVLDRYLRQRTGHHQRDGIAITDVLIDDTQPSRILGYCTLSTAEADLHEPREPDRKRLLAYPRYPTAGSAGWLSR